MHSLPTLKWFRLKKKKKPVCICTCVCVKRDRETGRVRDRSREKNQFCKLLKIGQSMPKRHSFLLARHLSIIASEDQSEDLPGHNIYFSTPKDWEP